MFHRPKQEPRQDSAQENARQDAEVRRAERMSTEPQKAPLQTYIDEQEQQKAKSEPVQAAPKNEDISPKQEAKTMKNEQMESQEKETRQMEAPAGAPFQRPPQMQRSTPAYTGTAGFGSQGSSSMADKSGADRRLVIGQGITMSGEIEACDYLLVEGTLEAALKGAKVLEVAETGTFYGAVEIEEATVAGRFEGDLTVNGRLTIKAGGSVTGSIAYRELAVEAGAMLDGKLSPLASSGAEAAKSVKKSMAPKNDNSGVEEEGAGQLPFSSSSAAAAE